MKEIITIIKELKNYPSNFFVYVQSGDSDLKDGLVVCELSGNEVGFIETGTNDGEVIQ